MKYRKKPIVITATQYKKGEYVAGVCICSNGAGNPHIHTLEGIMIVSEGDYIITGIKGEQYPCKQDIFEQTYERADDTP